VVNSAAVLERVRDERAELGFVESPGPIVGLACRTVLTDELVVVVSPDHPWARRRRPLPPRALASEPLVLREPGSGTRDTLSQALAEIGLGEPSAALELGSSSAVRAAAIAGAAPAVLSRLAVEDAVAAGRLHIVEVDGLDLGRELRAVWLPTRRLSPSARVLLERAAAGEPGGDAASRSPRVVDAGRPT
jgi:DNA-binding transcriptional LysR family regulator